MATRNPAIVHQLRLVGYPMGFCHKALYIPGGKTRRISSTNNQGGQILSRSQLEGSSSPLDLVIQFVTFLGWLSDPFKGLSDQKGTLNHLRYIFFQTIRTRTVHPKKLKKKTNFTPLCG